VAKVVFGDVRSIGQDESINHYSKLCDVDRFMAIGSSHDFAVFEDAAEAIGLKFLEKLVASRGSFNGLSFRGTKIVTKGEVGVFVTVTHDRRRGLSKLIDYMQLFSTKRICSTMSATGMFRRTRLPMTITFIAGFVYAPSRAPS